jgi:hypothetical protein
MTTRTVPVEVQAYLRRVRDRAPVELRLGPPERFADELRAAAGLPPRAGAAPARIHLRDRARALAPHLRTAAPLRWVAAAYAGLATVGMSEGGQRAQVTLALAVAAVLLAAAVTAARRRPPRWLTVGLAIAVLPVVVALAGRPATIARSRSR